MGLMLKLNLSPLLGTLLRPLLWALINVLLWGLLFVLHLESQNWAYKFFYILKMY